MQTVTKVLEFFKKGQNHVELQELKKMSRRFDDHWRVIMREEQNLLIFICAFIYICISITLVLVGRSLRQINFLNFVPYLLMYTHIHITSIIIINRHFVINQLVGGQALPASSSCSLVTYNTMRVVLPSVKVEKWGVLSIQQSLLK